MRVGVARWNWSATGRPDRLPSTGHQWASSRRWWVVVRSPDGQRRRSRSFGRRGRPASGTHVTTTRIERRLPTVPSGWSSRLSGHNTSDTGGTVRGAVVAGPSGPKRCLGPGPGTSHRARGPESNGHGYGDHPETPLARSGGRGSLRSSLRCGACSAGRAALSRARGAKRRGRPGHADRASPFRSARSAPPRTATASHTPPQPTAGARSLTLTARRASLARNCPRPRWREAREQARADRTADRRFGGQPSTYRAARRP
jgi:hypothetical protein